MLSSVPLCHPAEAQPSRSKLRLASARLSIGIAVPSGKGHAGRFLLAASGRTELKRTRHRLRIATGLAWLGLAPASNGAFLAAWIIANAIGAFVLAPMPFYCAAPR
jgi:hypothetical protein